MIEVTIWLAYSTLPIDELRKDDSRVKDAGLHGNAESACKCKTDLPSPWCSVCKHLSLAFSWVSGFENCRPNSTLTSLSEELEISRRSILQNNINSYFKTRSEWILFRSTFLPLMPTTGNKHGSCFLRNSAWSVSGVSSRGHRLSEW